jgi:hypothetical protein
MFTMEGILRRLLYRGRGAGTMHRDRGGFLFVAAAALMCGVATAHSGPCAVQISELEKQVNHIAPGPDSGPTGPQTVGAQLHRQPTPGSVEQAEHAANADADTALDRARKDDAAGDARGCIEALSEAKRLYGID